MSIDDILEVVPYVALSTQHSIALPTPKNSSINFLTFLDQRRHRVEIHEPDGRNDIFPRETVYNALNFVLGCHPGSNSASFA